MDYTVSVGNKQVGRVRMLREGLYYKIECRAELTGSISYRLTAVTDGARENIGILCPDGSGWSLTRKVPCKRLNPDNLKFLLLPSHEPMEGKFVALSPEEPFAYLEQLKDLYLKKQQDRMGVIVKE